jgi:hypothetical protein
MPEAMLMEQIANRYPGWDWDDFTLTCPCGYQIEWDGTCPEGCVSPLVQQGLI